MKADTNKGRADSKSTAITLTPGDHTRLQRHASAHGVTNNRYHQIALRFLMDCEDAFGGPLNEDLRKAVVVRVKDFSKKFRRLIDSADDK